MSKEYKIVNDPVYGYLRIDPIPDQQEVEEYYRREFYSANYDKFNDSSLEVQEDEAQFFRSRFDSMYRVFSQHFNDTNNLSLFDIGFGFAQALMYFREKGMKVSGLEPSLEGVSYAKEQGLNVYHSDIEDFSCVKSEKFCIVTMLNVLEHLRNPVNILIKIREQLLKSNGLLVIDVPNEFNDFQITADAEFKLNRWWVSPPAHINYFSTTSLKRLLEQCDYKVIHSESSFPLEIFLLMNDIYVGDNELGKVCHKKRVQFEYLMKKHGKQEKLYKLYQCLAELDLGRQSVVYAVKKQR